MPLKLLPLAATETGYTEKALRRKIQEGVLIEGVHWFKSPDGRLAIDMEAFERWQRSETQSASAH